MYEAFYHLSTDPFRLTPDPRFCFRHHSYNQAWAYLRYAFRQAEGFVMVTGRTGTGKTTLIDAFQKELRQQRVVVARIASASLEAIDLLRAAAYAYGIDVEGLDKATLLRRIEQFLIKQTQSRKRVLLIIDEAQGLPRSALEELRLLADLYTDSRPLLQVFLVGQEKLRDVMNDLEMEQFQQRIIGACHLEAMNLTETRSYVEHRLQRAGWQGDPQLTGPALIGIYRYSKGVPRHINKISSRLLLYGSLEHKHELDEEDVLTVAKELRGEQLAPIENDQTTFGQAEDNTLESELREASLRVEDLAIRTPSRPAGSPERAAVVQTAAHASRDKVRTLHTRRPAVQREPVAVQKPPVKPLPHTASPVQPEIRNGWLQQLIKATGVVYYEAIRAGVFLWHGIRKWLLDSWNRLRMVRFTDRFNWKGELAVLVGALAVLTLSATGLTMYLGRDAGEHNVLVMTEPKQAAFVSAAEGANVGPVATKPATGVAVAKVEIVSTPPEVAPVAEVDVGASLDYQTPGRDAEPDESESSHTVIAPNTTPAAKKSQGSDNGAPAPQHGGPSPLETAAVAAPPALSAEPEEPAEVPLTAELEAEPEATADTETEQVTPVAVAALEPRIVETQAAPPPAEDVEQESIADLLSLGRESYQADRLLIPKEDSAYYYYQQVLALEPDNPQALQGMEQIVKRYILLARSAMSRQETDRASRYVARGLRIHPGDRRLVILRNNLRAATEPVRAKTAPRLPPPIPVEEQAQVVESDAQKENFFSRLKSFFEEDQIAVEEAPLWEEDSSDW